MAGEQVIGKSILSIPTFTQRWDSQSAEKSQNIDHAFTLKYLSALHSFIQPLFNPWKYGVFPQDTLWFKEKVNVFQ